mgnify:CR=1 FL=1
MNETKNQRPRKKDGFGNMPYTLGTKMREGKKMYCMTAKDSGKEYCYHSEEARKNGMRMHEAYKHGFKPTQKGK